MARFQGHTAWKGRQMRLPDPVDRESGPVREGLRLKPMEQRPGPAQPLLRASDVDYPAYARRNMEQGRVVARITVGTDGRVMACGIGQSSGSKTLDSGTCVLAMRRMLYAPARDVQGNAVASMVTQAVNWVLPDEEPAPSP